MTQLPQGWVKITGASLWHLIWSSPTRPTGNNFLLTLVFFQIGLQVGLRVVQFELGDTAFAIALVVLTLGIVAALLFAASRSQTPSLNFDESAVRVGRATYRFDEVTDSTFLIVPHRKGSSSFLLFGTGKLATSAIVCVRSQREPELTDSEREFVAEVLRRTNIVVPQPKPDPYDPTGRFGWMDHPNSLSKDEAIEFVLHTPESGEPVRTAERPKSIWIDED
ncbi:hypothetical protein [Conyzicola sp.]|uniref:hypothetical protein n=1 Tax=Conyzicola sp. TaxID=1969404 RepID=UPI0039898232